MEMETVILSERVWMEMPAIGTGEAEDPVRSKYAIQGKALLIHQKGKVYVSFGNELDRQEAAKQADCRCLTLSEARIFEESLPFPLSPQLFPYNNKNDKRRPIGLGEVVARLTRLAGVPECRACQQRKRLLNRIVVWGWWRK